MILKEFPSSSATKGVVRVYRIAHFILAGIETSPVKVYTPRPEHCLHFFVHERETAEYPDGRRLQSGCALTGLHDVTVRRFVPRDFLMLQVVFEPTALHRLTRIHAAALRNQYIDATSVWGSEVLRINEQLCEARSYAHMVGIVDGFVARLVARSRAVRKFDLALQVLRDNPGVSIDWLAHRTSLSMRQFERRCRQQIGMGPKEFLRLGRFDRAFYTKLSHPGRDWLTIAVDCGYTDYQHMVKDFKDFTSQTPPKAFEAQSTSPERLLGVTQEFDVTDPGRDA